MTRTPISTFFDDATGLGGSYSFAHDDPAIAWLVSHGIVPFFELDAGPKLYGSYSSSAQQPLMHNPAEYGKFCAATTAHLRATYPALGASMPAYFTMPINEPNNGGWDASRTDNPALYAESAGGEALYMKTCYAAIKAVFPNAHVYGGELATAAESSPTSMPNELARWYGLGCRVGVCFDGVSLHISPIGNPSERFTHCIEPNNGWTFFCVNEMQAVARKFGDRALHAMITETGITSVPNANTSAGDEPGQAWWASQALKAALADASIDGIFWTNLNTDKLYGPSSIFYGTSLIDTSGGTERRKAAFYTFCRFAKFPKTCDDPIAPAKSHQ